MSIEISRREKNNSLYLMRVDALGEVLLQRITELLDERADLTRPEFGRRLPRGHSWISEFFAGLRTTNDLRLVVKIARVFGVSVGYLLGEKAKVDDAQTLTMLSAWDRLEKPDREVVLNLALNLRGRVGPSGDAESDGPGAESGTGGTRTSGASGKPRAKKHR